MPETLQEFASRQVPINHVYPDNLVTHFTTHVVAQFQQDHFILSFFEIFPPPLLGETDDEKLRALKALDHVDAKCVARIVVTPARMEDVIKILSENLAKYKQMAGDPQKEKGDGQ
jgi:hypothetical protein